MNPPLDSNTDDLDDEMEEYCDDCGYPLDQCECNDDEYEEDEDDDGVL